MWNLSTPCWFAPAGTCIHSIGPESDDKTRFSETLIQDNLIVVASIVAMKVWPPALPLAYLHTLNSYDTGFLGKCVGLKNVAPRIEQEDKLGSWRGGPQN